MELTCKEIRDCFLDEYERINIFHPKKVYFEIYLCRTEEERAFKTTYKFSWLTYDDNNIYLKNRFGKTKKILNKQNTHWIAFISLCDKNLKFKLCDFNCIGIKEVEL